MNGFIKEDHDSDVEVLDADILKKHWLQNQVCLVKQLMTCGKPVPVEWIEFETFIQENIDWRPSFGLIHAIWTKMCKIEENVGTSSQGPELNKYNQLSEVVEGNESVFTQPDPEDSRLGTKELKLSDEQSEAGYSSENILRCNFSEQSDSSHNSSLTKKKKKKKEKSDVPYAESYSGNVELSVNVSRKDNCSPLSIKSFGSIKSEEVDDQNELPCENSLNRKKKHRNKNSIQQSEQCCPVQNIKQESLDDEVSPSKSNNLSPPSFNKKKKKSNEIHTASSSTESESNLLNESFVSLANDSFSSKNNSSRKNRKKKAANISDDEITTSSKSKRKKKKSEVMSEAEADALREELLADRIIELELPKVIKEMKGALTKIDKCINNLEIKGKLSKLDKQLSKLENKSLIKKLGKRKKST